MDAASNRVRVTYPDANYVTYTYDALNRVSQVGENGATSGAGLLAVYAYDLLSRRQSITRGNGTATTYDNYDLASRLTSATFNFGGTSFDSTLTFGYTGAGQMNARATTNAAFGWWTVPDSTHSYVSDGLNRYASVNGTVFTYDANGNLTGDGARTFSYDIENRLTSVGGSSQLALDYDPLGRLRQTMSGSTATDLVYEGGRLVAEYSGSTLLRRYVHGAGTDEPIVWYEGSGLTDRRHLHSDERGSIAATTDAAGVATAYHYGPYGEPTAWSGSRFRYTGQIVLPEVGLYYYKARVYDPKLGRFLQTDPIGFDDDLNLYSYTGSDPLNRTDPLGLAEMNLFSPYAGETIYTYSLKFDTPAFDVAAHGDHVLGKVLNATTMRLPSTGIPISPEGLVRQATGVKGVLPGYGYVPGTPMLLAVCGISKEYAAAVSAAAHATVTFTSGQARYKKEVDGHTSVFVTTRDGKISNWESIRVNGSNVTYTSASGAVTHFSYNAKTGMLTEAEAQTGSHIKQQSCGDPNKCGGQQ
ncbi:MAG: RHS repeat-associated core domain-containing protein, partial [Gammaproteobacteria bacterium]